MSREDRSIEEENKLANAYKWDGSKEMTASRCGVYWAFSLVLWSADLELCSQGWHFYF